MRSIFFYLFSLSIICLVGCVKEVEPSIPQVTSGELLIIDQFQSTNIKSRPIHVWLPPKYLAGDTLGVVYMNDGQMLYDGRVTWNKQEWGIDEFFTEYPELQEYIIVGVFNGGADRRNEYFPQKAISYLNENGLVQIKAVGYDTVLSQINSDDYLLFLVNELKPYIEQEFRVYPTKDQTAIMGSSMGGLISMYAITEYPDVFGTAICMSTHWPGMFKNEDNPIPKAFQDYLWNTIDASAGSRYYFDYGDQTLDSLYREHQLVVDSIFLAKGFNDQNYFSKEFSGANHSEEAWRSRLIEPFSFLIQE